MDPLAGIKPEKDTTYYLMLACAERGHSVAHLRPQDLWLDQNRLFGRVSWVDVQDCLKSPFTVQDTADLPMAEFDVVWLRADPPFDRRYFYATLLLDHLPPATRVLNRPAGLRNWNEKLAALALPEYTPPTLVSSDPARLEAFCKQHGRIVLKPLDGFGGRGIRFYSGDNPEQLEEVTARQRRWILAQAYVPAAEAGDKRVLLLEGEPLGAVLRVAAAGESINNLDAGGRAEPAELSEHQRAVCAAIAPLLREQGVFFAGLDFLGEWLTEVNITSPTGLQELCRFSRLDHHLTIIARLEETDN